MSDARVIGGMVVCDDGSWSGTRSDDMSLMTGTFLLDAEGDTLDEDILSWCCWLPAMDDTPRRPERIE